MAERKSGPVKPPVLDLKVRDPEPVAEAPSAARSGKTSAAAEAAVAAPAANPEPGPRKSEPATEAKPAAERPAAASRPASSLPPPPLPRPPARLAMPWSAISIAAVIGALLGTALTYALVNVLPLPDNGPKLVDPAPRLSTIEASVDTLDARATDLEAQTKKTQISLDATIAQLDAATNALKQQIDAVPVPSTPVDLAPIETEIKTLEGRIAAIGAGASSADAETLADTISSIQTSLTDLGGKLDSATQRVAASEASVKSLGTELDAAKAAIAVQNQTLAGAEVSPAVRLPLIVAGLENAFDNGHQYASELSALTTLLPDLVVPPPILSSAEHGLPRPDAVANAFSDAMPAILAGRTGSGTGDWGQDAVDWVKGLLALRPAGEEEGTDPEAMVSRLEAAIGRRDFVAAAALLDGLPAPMRAGAGAVAGDIDALAAADQFVSSLRTEVLSPPAPAAAPKTDGGTAQ